MYRERLTKGYLGQREGGIEEVREKGRNCGTEEGKNKKSETWKCKQKKEGEREEQIDRNGMDKEIDRMRER